MKIITAFIILLLSGCSSGPLHYSDGRQDVAKAEDRQLIYELLGHARFVNKIYAKDKTNEEYAIIYSELNRRHPKWDWEAIKSKQIAVGMTEEEVLLAWGRPDKINRASYGDQWVYRRGDVDAQYLYFKESIVTSFN